MGANLLEFSANDEMQKVQTLADEFYKYILYDEEPLFVSDEATLWGVWMGDVDEVLDRCSRHYGILVTLEQTQQPLWKLLLMLSKLRLTKVRD